MKKGITFSVIIVAIVIMLIVISSASVIGSNAISGANFEKYQMELNFVLDDVNEYFVSNNKLPVSGVIVSYDTLASDLKQKILENGDNESKLYVVDLSLIGDSNIKRGYGDVSSKDVFIVSEDTHNVYYLDGFGYKGIMYYCM